MPELPEVETLKLGLEKYLIGLTIIRVEVILKKQLEGDPKVILGAKVIGVRRFGKGLVIDLDNAYSLAIHIKLTGQLIYQDVKTKKIPVSHEKVGTLPNQFTHIIFHFDHDANLYYNDLRQFGWIKIIPTDHLTQIAFFKDLGPDILQITYKQFDAVLSKVKTAVKVLLLDQKKFSGIGNIYANDALYLAKIDPRRPANSLESEGKQNLYRSIHTVLQKGLQEGGASELTFVNILGQIGNYQNHTLIYGKQGKKCPTCQTVIKKFMLGGRGTYICPHCQV